jgi:predicted DNA-binding transcriptional regulator AlpA
MNKAKLPTKRIVEEVVSCIDPLLSKKAVCSAVTLSHAQLMRMVKDGAFPKPLRIGPVRICWRASTVQAWIDALTSDRPVLRRGNQRNARAIGAHVAG